MSDTRQGLIRCFQAVFPELSESEAAQASMSSVAEWDSVATVILAAAVEEELGIQFDPEEIERMNSFQSYLDLVASRQCA